MGTRQERIAMWRRLLDFAGAARSQLGRMFLVVQRERVRHFVGQGEREEDFHFVERYFLGVLAGEELVCREGRYGIPAMACVEVSLNASSEPMPGPFMFPLGRWPHQPNTVAIGSREKAEFEVIVGDAAVLRYRPAVYMRDDPWSAALMYAARLLGKDLRDE